MYVCLKFHRYNYNARVSLHCVNVQKCFVQYKQRGHDHFFCPIDDGRVSQDFHFFSVNDREQTSCILFQTKVTRPFSLALLFVRVIWQTRYKRTKSNENENHPTARRGWLIARLVLETTTRWTEYSWYAHCRFYIRRWGQLASSQMALNLLSGWLVRIFPFCFSNFPVYSSVIFGAFYSLCNV